MILTVTLNPAIDKILILNNFEVHKLHRLETEEMSMITAGGKGVNIAHTLKLLGNEVIASGFAGGHAGHMLCDSIREMGITTNFIFTNGSTRTNTSILDRKHETLTEINDFGQEIPQEDIDFFIENYERLLNRVDLVVIAGSLPLGISAGVYKRLIDKAHEHKKRVIIHTSPDYTEEIMKSSPFLITPDMRSNHELFGKPVDGISGFLEAGRYILTHTVETEYVIFTHRIENVVAVTRDKSYIVRPTDLKIVNMLGYGTLTWPGFIHALAQNLPTTAVLQYASAAGLTDVEDLYKEIRDVHKIEENISRIVVEEVE
jgi:1-phosphofructokinase family hexose kinase